MDHPDYFPGNQWMSLNETEYLILGAHGIHKITLDFSREEQDEVKASVALEVKDFKYL